MHEVPASTNVSAELRAAIADLCGRCRAFDVQIASRWAQFAAAAGFDPKTEASGTAALIFGDIDLVMAAVSQQPERVGFVIPDAFTPGRFTGRARVRSDATQQLWGAGWSVQAVERIEVPVTGGRIEFVVGEARSYPTSALNDVD